MAAKEKPQEQLKKSQHLAKWDPAKEFMTLRKSFMDMFDDFWAHKSFTLPTASLSNWKKGIWQPAVDIHETKKEVIISASLPGLKREDVKIDMKNNILTIKGKRREESKIEEKNYYRREQTYGSFERNLSLPNYVDPDKVKANYKNGLLEIRIPKVAKLKSKSKSINIE